MKLKILLISMTILCSLATASNARNIGNGVAINNPKLQNNGNDITFSALIDSGETMDIGCNGSYRLQFYIENGGTRLELPEVVYYGNQRYRFDRRNEFLSREHPAEPYKVYTKVNKRIPGDLDYSVTIPYSAWMTGAQIRYQWQKFDCAGEMIVSAGAVSEEIRHMNRRWMPERETFAAMVTFYPADPEEYIDRRTLTLKKGKRREARVSLFVQFPQDDPQIHPDFADNAAELGKVDSLLTQLLDNEMTAVSQLNITGFASPEGALWRNTNLARYRAENVRQYISDKHDTSALSVDVQSVAVDWEGLITSVATSDLPYKNDMISIIQTNKDNPELCERLLRSVGGGRPHSIMLEEVYPRLRRTEVHAEFIVADMTPEQAKQLLYTNPEMLSLDEMYRIAQTIPSDSGEYAEVFRIAARQFPDDFVANNNAAAVHLERGDADGAYRYIVKIAHDPRSYLNVAAYYYLVGDVERAKKYLNMAVGENIPGASEQLEKLAE